MFSRLHDTAGNHSGPASGAPRPPTGSHRSRTACAASADPSSPPSYSPSSAGLLMDLDATGDTARTTGPSPTSSPRSTAPDRPCAHKRSHANAVGGKMPPPARRQARNARSNQTPYSPTAGRLRPRPPLRSTQVSPPWSSRDGSSPQAGHWSGRIQGNWRGHGVALPSLPSAQIRVLVRSVPARPGRTAGGCIVRGRRPLRRGTERVGGTVRRARIGRDRAATHRRVPRAGRVPALAREPVRWCEGHAGMSVGRAVAPRCRQPPEASVFTMHRDPSQE